MVRGKLVMIKFWKSLQNVLRKFSKLKKNYVLHINKKLADSNTAPKTYWTVLNRLLYNKKIPAMPPLLVNGKFVSDFCEKANISNNFFASICTIIDNASYLPSFSYRTGSTILFMLLKMIYQQ